MTKPQPSSQPHSLDAEAAVLGAIVIDGDAIHKLTSLLPEHFYDPVYRMVFVAARELADQSKPIDFVTLSDQLKENKKIEAIGGSAFLASLFEKVPSASTVEYYAAIVINNALKRAYISAGQSIVGIAYEESSTAAEVQTAAEQELFAIGEQRTLGGFASAKQRTDEWYEQVAELHELSDDDRQARRVRTGFHSLDRKLNLRPGKFTIIAGRPGMGKSAFALNLAINACEQDKTIGFFSYEMPVNDIMDRIVASQLGVNSRLLEEGNLDEQLYSKVGPVLSKINSFKFYLEFAPDRLLSTLVSRATRLKQQHDLDILFVDYLQLVYTTEKFAQQSRLQMVSHVSNTLMYLAKHLGITIVGLSQLSRNCENRPDKRPQLSDLRETGELEQDADAVLMLYREDYYEPDTDRQNIVDVFVRKNRGGETGSCELYFNREHQVFTSVHNESVTTPSLVAA